MVENFCRKIQMCQYLLDSDCLQMFTDPRIFQFNLDAQMQNLVKQTSTPADTLNRFKQASNKLSGKSVDEDIFQMISKFKLFINEQSKLLNTCGTIIERAMTNKTEYDVQKAKFYTQMEELEELIAGELGQNKYLMRAEQKVLDRFSEVNNDTHWRALESVDDFVRDQLADIQSYQDAFTEISKHHTKMVQVKSQLDAKTTNLATLEKKQISLQKAQQARLQMDQTEVAYYEANLVYNIMVINMAYVTIPLFKRQKR